MAIFDNFDNIGEEIEEFFEGLASNFSSKETPDGGWVKSRIELAELKRQEKELLIEIGRLSYEDNPAKWAQSKSLRQVKQKISLIEDDLQRVRTARKEAKKPEGAACSTCGAYNAEGTKYCKECGSNLLAKASKFCIKCGEALVPNASFCASCGSKQS
ncbi:MAG: zinc ribbon domain-containing protein [Eubacteriaceae bacterium]|nr:zinc ribbon domain-containing protein [Eubacteriaceae bacterium]